MSQITGLAKLAHIDMVLMLHMTRTCSIAAFAYLMKIMMNTRGEYTDHINVDGPL